MENNKIKGKRKRQIIACIIWSLLLIVSIIFFMALDSDSNMTLAGVAVVAAIISGIGLFVSYKKMINFRRKTCDSCHESLDGCAWEYQETSSKFENGREKVSF